MAYLVIREGSKWTDVFRLVPGQTVTIGRAPTNQIVVKDERCSRNHAEIFLSHGNWKLRDLESRNGTAIGELMVEGDYELQPGDIVRIGRSQLAFVHDLSKAFGDTSSILLPNEQATAAISDSAVLASGEPPATITHRRQKTRYLDGSGTGDDTIPTGGAAARLCRLAFEIAKAGRMEDIVETAINGLFDDTQADTGAILLAPRNVTGEPTAEELEIVTSRADGDHRYQRVSPFLAATVMREGEAVLARNVVDDSNMASRDSNGEILATSVICAPIRHGRLVVGLIHLYSIAEHHPLVPEDLEFTLAVADTVAQALENVTQREQLTQNLNVARHENVELRERLGVQSEIVGKSSVVEDLTAQIARAAETKATVLIRGESGVGKELVARAIHFSSNRRDAAFVCLNCAALSETLLESELFGHEKGAFTGATERKIGKFEAAHEGTLMLDEIGEMSPAIQSKFLRVLEGHPFERVGGHQQVKVDVRVIAATNRDLEQSVAENQFRRDLYFRLRVLEVFVLPLRRRPDDIPVLAHHFLQKFNQETARKIRGYTPAAMEQMTRYRWPGNIRELRNVVERAVVLAGGEYIDTGDLMLSTIPTAGDTGGLAYDGNSYEPITLEELERRHVLATLEANDWNKSQSANILGIERSTLDRKIRRYHLKESKERS